MKCVPPKSITDAVLISSSVPEADYAAYNAATTYAVGDYCIVAATHRIYKSLKATNLNHYPPDNTSGTDPWWQDVSATNRWKMFDTYIASQASQAESIVIELDASGCDTVALFTLEAETVELELTDDESTVLYSETIELLYDDYTDWTAVFFKQPELKGKIYRTMPISYGTTLKVTISAPGGTAKCGHCVIGQGKWIGSSKYGISEGILDYSKRSRNDFGEAYLKQGDYADTSTADSWVPAGARPQVKNFLTGVRATPCVWHLDNQDEAKDEDLVLFAFYEDFRLTLELPTMSGCTLTLQGLT